MLEEIGPMRDCAPFAAEPGLSEVPEHGLRRRQMIVLGSASTMVALFEARQGECNGLHDHIASDSKRGEGHELPYDHGAS